MTTSTESLTRRLARFAAELRYADLPPEAVTTAKRLTLDTLGTALAATTLGEGAREVVAVMSAFGGPPESTILGTDVKVAAPHAAFANGALAHALNYDAVGNAAGHTGVVCLATPLAVAESLAPVSGERFLTAVVAAAEVSARVIGPVVQGYRRFSELILAGQYFGYLGAAAAAGSLLGLDSEAMHSAFGLALMQTAGSRAVIVGGDVPAKAIYGAFPNHGGVIAALLAHAGLDAAIDALDGAAGLYAMSSGGVFDAAIVTQGLGTTWRFLQTEFKPWPTSGVVVPFIEAALALASEHDLHAGSIDAVEIVGHSHMRQWCEPLAERRRPANNAAAANSTLFATAKALAHRAVVLADFAPAGLRDELALGVAERTTYRLDDDVRGGIVIVRTRDGRTLRAGVETPLGHPERPISEERLHAKFRDCCSYATGLGQADADALIAFVAQLERCEDVAFLAAQHPGEVRAG